MKTRDERRRHIKVVVEDDSHDGRDAAPVEHGGDDDPRDSRAVTPERDGPEDDTATPASLEGESASGDPEEGGTKTAKESESEHDRLREELQASAEKLKTLRKERDQLYERWLRASADLDNYRKRIDREREEFRRSALEAIFVDLIQVLDNFDRALSALPQDAPKGVLDGVRLIHKQLLDLLGKRGLVSMERSEGSFDPRVQEAVATEVRDDVPHHEVLDEVQKGYLYAGRVLRPALVRVSVRPDASENDGPAEGAN